MEAREHQGGHQGCRKPREMEVHGSELYHDGGESERGDPGSRQHQPDRAERKEADGGCGREPDRLE